MLTTPFVATTNSVAPTSFNDKFSIMISYILDSYVSRHMTCLRDILNDVINIALVSITSPNGCKIMYNCEDSIFLLLSVTYVLNLTCH